MRCMCGTILEISSEDDGRRQSCPSCRRRFDVRRAEAVGGGRPGVSLLYLTDEGRGSGETSTLGGTTSFQLPAPGPAASTAALEKEPEAPDEAHFRCACGALLAVTKSQYEKRSSCPSCGARMIVFLLFDARARTFTLQFFSLIDPKSGATGVLTRL